MENPMFFQFKSVVGGGYIVDIAYTKPVEPGLEWQTGHSHLGRIRITEVLSSRETVKNGKNHFEPGTIFYQVQVVKVD